MTTPTSNYKTRQLIAVATLPALIVGAVVFYVAVVNDRLPAEVAIHWGPEGTPDGFTSRSSLPWQVAAVLAVTTLPVTILALFLDGATAFMPKAINGLAAGLALFVGSLVILGVTPQLDMTTAPDLRLWVIPVAAAIAIFGGAIAAGVAGSPPSSPHSDAPAPAHANRHDLSPGQTAVWAGRTPTGKALTIAPVGLLLVSVVVSALTSWWLVAIVAAVLLVVLTTSSFSVTAGPAGVRVSGLLGFPRITVPLSQIAQASPGRVKAREYGGWGWRIKKGSTAVLTRSGPALTVTRTDGAMLHITIDDPEKPAALISTLLDRRAQA